MTDTPSFLDLGIGWFFAPDTDWAMQGDSNGAFYPRGFIADAESDRPDTFFGPAAWGRQTGPSCGQVLLEVENKYLQSFLMEDDSEPSTVVVPRTPFPGMLHVTKAGIASGLDALNGFEVQSFDSLVAMILPALHARSSKPLSVESSADRLAGVRERWPHLCESE